MALLSFIALVSTALLVLACTPAPLTAPPPREAGPRYGGVLNVRVAGDPFDWDLSYSGKTSNNWNGLGMAYNQLLGFKRGPDVPYAELVPQPELAERWQVSPDTRAFTFHLRKGVKYAGLPPVGDRELSPADVQWSFEYYTRTGSFKDKGLPRGQIDSLFEGLEAVRTPDPSTVVVQFKEPFAPFLNYAAWEWASIVPREIYEEDGHLKDRVAGTGPYQLDAASSQKGTRWVWKRNPAYWEPGKPYMDEIRWLVVADDGAALAAFQAQQLDLLSGGYTAQHAEQVRKDISGAVVYEYLSPTAQHLYIQSRFPPLSDLRLRKAISLGLDRDELLKAAAGGKGGWALAGALPDTFTQEEVKQVLRYDPGAARRLIVEAGFPDGLALEFIFSNQYGQRERTQAELLQAQLKRIGINMEIKLLNDVDFTRRRRAGEYHLAPATKALAGDVDSYVAAFMLKSGLGGSSVDDATLDEMVIAQRREADPIRRTELVRKAVRYANENAFNLALFFGPDYQFWHPHVKNYAPHWGCRSCYAPDSWLDK